MLIAAGGKESEGIRQRAAELQAALSAPGSGFRSRLELFEGAAHVDYYPNLAAIALGATAPRSRPVPVQVAATQPPDPKSLARHVGRYSLADGRTFSLAMRQGGLALEFPGLPGGALIPAENGRFYVRGQEVDVLLGEGPDARLRVYGYEALGQRLPGP